MYIIKAWADVGSLGLLACYSNESGGSPYTPPTGFTELVDGGSGAADKAGALGVFYGRDGATLAMNATSTNAIWIAIGFEIAPYVDPVIPIVQRSAFATRRFNGRLI